MSPSYTKRTARRCVSRMQESGFTPRSILNVGMSKAPELVIWRELYPNVPVVGIDPVAWNTRDNVHYIRAIATNGTTPSAQYCTVCKSPVCLNPTTHKAPRWITVPTVRIDDISRDLLEPPHFIWMDIEGSEIVALRGAERTLKQTAWICIETFDWLPGHASAIDTLLRSSGFVQRLNFTHDTLYERVQAPSGQRPSDGDN